MKKRINIIRAVLIILGLAIVGLYAAPMYIFINIATIIGLAIGLVMIFAGIFLNKLIALCKKIFKHKKGKILLSSFFTVVMVGVLCLCTAVGSVIASANTNAKGQETLIVLGCFVRGDSPSYTLRQRLNATYAYLEENPEATAVLSGGQGANEKISEALCMYNYLVDKGIDESRLYMEDKSTDTDENIAFSKKVIEENHLSNNIAVVSSDYHLKRATMIAKKNGIDAARISSGSTFMDKPNFYLREGLGVVKEFVFG
ncbi:MAG: YdcF family protein [Clostridium sp.]|nr:YdcF family protein [Clostridium sp.]